MKKTTLICDIEDRKHSGEVKTYEVPVMFDYDQNDGKSKMTPYFEMHKLDLCESCFKHMVETRTIIYAYGAMGYNKYFLRKGDD